MFKKLIVSFIILCSILFFNFAFLGKLSKAFELLGAGLTVLLIVFYGIYDNSFRFKRTFSPYIIIVLLSLPFSMYMADIYHNQPISISLYAQRSMYYYLFYFALHLIKIKPEDFGKLFVLFGALYISLYFLQFLLYPKVTLFDARISKERGSIRIFLAGMSYLIICYYYVLQKFLESQQLKYTLLLLASFIIIILVGSRTLLFTIVVTTILNLILSKRINSRLITYSLSAVGIVLILFMFRNIFQELIATSLHQDPLSAENIRFKAARYFMSRLFPNTLTYIFGNGPSTGQSEYGYSVGLASMRYGFYLADIGIIGEYVNYGLIFIAGVFLIVYKALISKIQPEFNYIKYFYAFTVIAMILGGGFDDSDFIVLLCITLYIIDVSKFRLKNSKNPDNLENSVNPAQVQTENGYNTPENLLDQAV